MLVVGQKTSIRLREDGHSILAIFGREDSVPRTPSGAVWREDIYHESP